MAAPAVSQSASARPYPAVDVCLECAISIMIYRAGRMKAELPVARKPAEFVGSALEDLSAFPGAVKTVMGFAIHLAQIGGIHPNAKPLKASAEQEWWRLWMTMMVIPTGRFTP